MKLQTGIESLTERTEMVTLFLDEKILKSYVFLPNYKAVSRGILKILYTLLLKIKELSFKCNSRTLTS